jgi:hypothetical protein
MIIRRFFSDEIFFHIKTDFGFLVEKIIESGFEYDLQIRNNYLNLYYRGNSIGRVSYDIYIELYKVNIHHKFVINRIRERFVPANENDYLAFTLKKKQLHPFFSTENLKFMGQKVREINYQEETTFEQMIMTDNVGRKDFIIIDRQVSDKTSKTKMDLLALKHKNGNKYQFCILEVKLGNNPELKGRVIDQLNGYIERISNNFLDYKRCYEINFSQKKELGLLDKNLEIEIIPEVLGLVVVVGYSGIAKESIKLLKEKDSKIKILQLKNIIYL